MQIDNINSIWEGRSAGVKDERKIFFSFLFFYLFRATPEAYSGSQTRGLIGAVAASLHHSHSNWRSELRL